MRIFDNFLYKLVAVLIAALLWAAAQGVRDEDAAIDLELTFDDTPPELMVVDRSHPSVSVQLIGSRAAIRQARELTRFPISLAGVKPGRTHYQLDRRALNLQRNVKVQALSPSTVTVEVDSIVQRDFPVRVDVAGELPPGYRLVSLKVEPASVSLTGAQRTLRGVREISTEPFEVADVRASGVMELVLALGGLAHLDPNIEVPNVRVAFVVEAPEPTQADDAASEGGG